MPKRPLVQSTEHASSADAAATSSAKKQRSGPFRYGRLQLGEIRLVNLYPGDDASEITCTLSVAQLSSPPAYTALSYCWGDNTQAADIVVNGRRFSVTLSLYEALVGLRDVEDQVLVWIDQICIDQASVAEKNAQVQHMGDIYASAERTCVWLGRETPGMEDSMSVLHEFCTTTKSKKWLLRHANQIMDIFRRPWFHRLWVLQEVALSKQCDIACGDVLWAMYGLETIVTALSRLFLTVEETLAIDRHYFDPDGLKNVLEGLNCSGGIISMLLAENGIFNSEGIKFSFLHLLSRTRNRRCKDPRDHIYGLQGIYRAMQSAAADDLVDVDYNKDVTEVLTEATRACLLHPMGGGATVFLEVHNEGGCSTDDSGQTLQLPSWVPDWTQSPACSSFEPELYRAGGQDDFTFAPGIFLGGTKLMLQGLTICTIKNAEPWPQKLFQRWGIENGDFDGGWDEVETLAIVAAKKLNIHPWELLNMSMTAGRNYDNFDKKRSRAAALKNMRKTWAEHDKWLSWRLWRGTEVIMQDLKDQGESATQELRQEVEIAWNDFYCNSLLALGGRSLIMTSDERLALGPIACTTGDKVLVVPGMKMPLVLRKRQHNDCWQMLGPAYMYGIMAGEAMSYIGDGKDTLEEYVID